MAKAGFPPDFWDTRIKRIALEDYLTRQYSHAIRKVCKGKRGIGKSGLVAIDSGRQEILERSSVNIDGQSVEVRFIAGLPARCRTVLGIECIAMFLDEMPRIVEQSLFLCSLKVSELRTFIETAEDQEALRKWLEERELIAFVPNGAVLPRTSGVDDLPLQMSAVPFQPPGELEVEAGFLVHCYSQNYLDKSSDLREGLEKVTKDVEEKGFGILLPFKVGNFALPRIYEVAGAINRMRSLKVE